MVQVILLERVEQLGQMGDVVNVKPGFARNFLLPQKKALRATKQNLEVFEQRKAQLVADNLKRREEAEQVSKKMVGLSISMVRQAGESGQLYGSVNARDIAEMVTAAGFTVAARPGDHRQADQDHRRAFGARVAASRGQRDGRRQRRAVAGRGRCPAARRDPARARRRAAGRRARRLGCRPAGLPARVRWVYATPGMMWWPGGSAHARRRIFQPIGPGR